MLTNYTITSAIKRHVPSVTAPLMFVLIESDAKPLEKAEEWRKYLVRCYYSSYVFQRQTQWAP